MQMHAGRGARKQQQQKEAALYLYIFGFGHACTCEMPLVETGVHGTEGRGREVVPA